MKKKEWNGLCANGLHKAEHEGHVCDQCLLFISKLKTVLVNIVKAVEGVPK